MVDAVETATERNVSRHRRRWAWFVGACVVSLVAAGVTAGVWISHWRGSLHPLARYPLGGAEVPLSAGHTLFFDDMVDEASVFSHPWNPGTLTVTVDSIRPVVSTNTSGATVTVEKCVLSQGGHDMLGVDPATARQQCSTLTPFHSGTVTLGYDKGDIDIVVAIQPAHSGITDVHGVDVAFSAGWRHGSQHTGIQGRTRTR